MSEKNLPTRDELIIQRERLIAVVTSFQARLNLYGNWDDGCFYYNGVSASELVEPMRKAEEILKQVL